MTTQPEEYEIIEQLVLSGQMPDAHLIAMIAEDPAFAEWWRIRAQQRQGSKD